MAKIQISDIMAANAAQSMWGTYQRSLLSQVLETADESDVTNETAEFLQDTANGTLLLIAGTDSRVNDNGELVSPDGDVIEGARCFEKIQWITANGVDKTTQYYCAPANVNTETRARRVVQYWLDYRVRKASDVYDGINEKRNAAFAKAKEIENGATFLAKFGGGLNDAFVAAFADAYANAKRFGFEFSDIVTAAFETGTENK